MKLSKCILFATLALGANVASANLADCAMSGKNPLTDNRGASKKVASLLTSERGAPTANAPVSDSSGSAVAR